MKQGKRKNMGLMVLGVFILGTLVSSPAYAEALTAVDIRAGNAFTEADQVNSIFDYRFGFFGGRSQPEARDIEEGNKMAGDTIEGNTGLPRG